MLLLFYTFQSVPAEIVLFGPLTVPWDLGYTVMMTDQRNKRRSRRKKILLTHLATTREK